MKAIVLTRYGTPREAFTLETSVDALTTYTFNTHVAQHYFCKTCGIHAYYVPRSDPDMIDVNARCLDDVDVTALQVHPFDGKNWERAMTGDLPWRS